MLCQGLPQGSRKKKLRPFIEPIFHEISALPGYSINSLLRNIVLLEVQPVRKKVEALRGVDRRRMVLTPPPTETSVTWWPLLSIWQATRRSPSMRSSRDRSGASHELGL